MPRHNRYHRIIHRIIIRLILAAIFFLGVYIGFSLWTKISLPFHNPWDIVSRMTILKLNPADNIVRFLVLVICPNALLILTYLASYPFLGRARTICAAEDAHDLQGMEGARKHTFLHVSILVILIIMIAVNFITVWPKDTIDMYHDGETLASAVSWMEGQAPYKDYIIAHGVYQDPGRSVLAFKIFGRSIAAARTLDSINKITTFLLLGFFLLLAFRFHYGYALLALIILLPSPLFYFLSPMRPYCYTLNMAAERSFILPTIISPRNMTTFAFLATIAALSSYVRGEKRSAGAFSAITFLFSFIPFASFGYSIDNGFFLTAAYTMMAPLLYMLFFHGSAHRRRYLLSSCAGIASGVILLGFLMQWQFHAFVQFVFFTVPKYKELIDGMPFPIQSGPCALICVVLTGNIYWLIVRFLALLTSSGMRFAESMKRYVAQYTVELSLGLLSIMFFRIALGRSDWPHVAIGSLPAWILSVFILIRHYLHPYLSSQKTRVRAIVFHVIGALAAINIMVYFVIAMGKGLFHENFPLGDSDVSYVGEARMEAVDFVRNTLKPGDDIFVFLSEPAWYYLFNRLAPTRFLLPLTAAPNFYQDEVVRDLETRRVKYTLFRTDNSPSELDGVPLEMILNKIAAYVTEHYEFHKKINGYEFWIRK